jgi:hypothetical protein
VFVAASTNGGWEARLGGMVNRNESLINAVKASGPKVLIGPDQNGKEVGRACRHYTLADIVLPVERRNLNHPDM